MTKNHEGWGSFIELCLNINDKKNLEFLFELFLTPEEKSDLTMRFLIVKELLKKEKTQREISKDLNVSIAKITRGSNELKRMNKGLLKILEEKLF